MKLRHSKFSPFARKVRVCAHELGLAGKIELVESTPTTDTSLRALNPLGKIPVLILDDGGIFYDSPLVCEYLAELAKDDRLCPRSGERHWMVLRDQALGDGICDASVALRGERLKPEAMQYAPFAERQIAAINAALDVLEADAARLEGRCDLGVIAIGCGIGHIEVRHADLAWSAKRPKLAAWYSGFNARPSMASTKP
jgi:glutathione S-transferase